MLIEVGQEVYHEKTNLHYRVKAVKDLDNVAIEHDGQLRWVSANTLSQSYPRFKAGDKVICPQVPKNWQRAPVFVEKMKDFINELGTIISVSDSHVSVIFAKSVHSWGYRPEWLKLAEPNDFVPKVTDFQILMKPELKERLKKIADIQGRSLSSQATQILEMVIKTYDDGGQHSIIFGDEYLIFNRSHIRNPIKDSTSPPVQMSSQEKQNMLVAIWKKIWGTIK